MVNVDDGLGGLMSGRFRIFLVGVLSVLPAGVVGCRQTVQFAGAAVSQHPLRYVAPAADWRFAGLDARVPPRLRPGSYPSATRGVRFLGREDLGAHSYRFSTSEHSGIVYTCRAGHVDISHVRKGADWTGYIAAAVLDHLEHGRTVFEVKQVEPSLYRVVLTPPEGWYELDVTQRERIAKEVACDVGQYLAWTGLTWHEILTWFGYRSKVWQSEFPSAFSWEDSYSNLLGTHIAAGALRDSSRPFDEAVTALLDERLANLGAQSAEVTTEVTEALRGRWYSKRPFSTVISERNFDVGLDDGFVTPRLLPRVANCPAPAPWSLAVPALDSLDRYGFTMVVEIEPRVCEGPRILALLGFEKREMPRAFDPVVHFPRLIDHIEQDAVARGLSYTQGEAFGL